MTLRFRLLVLLVTVFFLVQLKGQERQLVFDKVNVKNGLAHNRVQAILKDRYGFMWFGTLEGLCRYDGTHVSLYRHDPNLLHTLPDYQITSLYEDADSILWIGTSNGGLCKYNQHTGVFSNYLLTEYLDQNVPRDVRSITKGDRGSLWIGLYGGGMAEFDVKTEKFRYYNQLSHDLPSNNILSILKDDDYLWISTDGGGVSRYNLLTDVFENFSASEKPGSLANNLVYCTFKDSKGHIWVGTDNGLCLFQESTKSFITYKTEKGTDSSLSDSRIKAIAEDRKGRLWVATGNGLNRIDDTNHPVLSVQRYMHDNFDMESLSSNVLLSLYVDDDDILWVGTLDGGVNQAILNDKQFVHYKYKESDPNGLSHNIVRSIYEDKEGNIWVGTDGGGLNVMRKGQSFFDHYNPSLSKFISYTQVLSIVQDLDGDLWFGTWGGGLLMLSKQYINNPENHFVQFTEKEGDKRSLPSNIVQDLFVDRDGRIWVGTEGGLAILDKEEGSFITFTADSGNKDNHISDNRVQSNTIIQDSKGNIWVGTWNGLNKILENNTPQPKTIDGVEVSPYSLYFVNIHNIPGDSTSLSDNRIISLFEDSKNNIWIGTYGKGVNCYNPKTDKYTRITESNGLSNNVVYTILEDKNKHLWFSTNNGLTRYDGEGKFRIFDESDGLQSNYFYWGAGLKLKNGNLVFGGTNGLNLFDPDAIKDNQKIPRVLISNLLINNQVVPFNEKSSILKLPIWNTQEIVLPFGNDQIQFNFVALNLIHPTKNRYAYKLEGFNDNWIDNGTTKTAIYTNLSPGSYVFKVKASNNDGVWNENGCSVRLIITPPFYHTWWFRVLIAVTFILIAGFFYWYKMTAVKRQSALLEKMVETRTKELHEANSVLYKLNMELNEVNALLEETNEEITEQKELVIFQKDQIEKKNEELERFRNHLEEVVEERTEELINAKEKAEESERLKASFLANMSHEIRTPLNAIVGFSNLLTMNSNTIEEINEFNDQITKNTESLLVLIDDILDLSMIEAKQSKINPKPIQVNNLLQNLFGYWYMHHHSESRQIRLTNVLVERDLIFFIDEHKLRQILTNLISNACKFTESGYVEIGFEKREREYLFWVKDTGIGIAEKYLSVVFEWFRKIEDDTNKLYRGSGLGLAISIRLAELLGGRMWVESELGKGSIFYFALPESIVYMGTESAI